MNKVYQLWNEILLLTQNETETETETSQKLTYQAKVIARNKSRFPRK